MFVISLERLAVTFLTLKRGLFSPHFPFPCLLPLQNDLVFLRARTKKHEVMVAPGEGYVLVVRNNCLAEAFFYFKL